jgi:hypothetical protein
MSRMHNALRMTVTGKMMDGLRPAWIRVLETKALPNLFVVEASYSLTEDKIPYA